MQTPKEPPLKVNTLATNTETETGKANVNAVKTDEIGTNTFKANTLNANTLSERQNANQSPVINIEQQKPSLSIQKLSHLLATLQQSQPNVFNDKSENTDKPLLPHGANNPSNSLPQMEAIDQLKTLITKVPQQLPGMNQLINPAQLAHCIAQFSTYSPLSTSSVNLSSLGPLASALQLILGAKGANSGTTLSPALMQQLNKILKRSAKPNAAMTQALQMLGNLSSLKPLEDVLTSLSSHITLYQYQNLESNINNHPLFYFTLPTKEQGIDQIEGEIEHQEDNDDGEKSWRLTLLLPVGENQKLKAVAALKAQQISLEFTCSDNALLARANSYQQFLSERFETLGFSDTKIVCSQSEIEQSLLKRPNQLVEIIV